MTKRLASMGTPEYQDLLHEHHFNGKVKCHEHKLEIPLRWEKSRMVFVNSMSDLFHEAVPFGFIDKVFAVMALRPQHTFQILTKRPERMAEYLCSRSHPEHGQDDLIHGDYVPVAMEKLGEDYSFAAEMIWPLPNVWLGTSCEDPKTLHERVPHLLNCPAAVRFLSLEPLLGETILHKHLAECGCGHGHGFTACPNTGGVAKTCHRCDCMNVNPKIQWVIVGCESGAKRRPCRWEWIDSIVGQCRDAGVSVFVKQLATQSDGSGTVYKHKPGDDWPAWVAPSLRVQEFPK
jgi:protein gp37